MNEKQNTTSNTPDSQNHHGECPWCLTHPHRDACSLNCARARRAKVEDDLARVQMEAHNQHHE